MLSVKVDRRYGGDDAKEILVQERPQGTFTRRLFLSDTHDLEHVQAEIRNGVLRLTIPTSEKARVRRIDVQGGHEEREVEVGAIDKTAKKK